MDDGLWLQCLSQEHFGMQTGTSNIPSTRLLAHCFNGLITNKWVGGERTEGTCQPSERGEGFYCCPL